MKALVVNCSAEHYNLGARKLSNWLPSQGYQVEMVNGDPGPMFTRGFDLVALSVIFSWHAPIARDIALRVLDTPACQVRCGGPGMFALAGWWKRETGLDITRGVDPRFDQQPGEYLYTFASRGCPVGCGFCLVPPMEGKQFTLYPDFTPAPYLLDNNLSALPDRYQLHIIQKYQAAGMQIEDAKEGFEPRAFDGDTFHRWNPVLKGPWRLGFDTISEAEDVRRMMGILQDVSPRRKQVYVLIGNEPFESCMERICKTIEWGGEPFCQPLIALNALEKVPLVRFDWTLEKLRAVARWANRRIWRQDPFENYSRRKDREKPAGSLELGWKSGYIV